MGCTRRGFVQHSALGAAVMSVLGRRLEGLTWSRWLDRSAKIRIGGCDWSLKLEGKLEAFAAAKQAGLDGVQVSLGRSEDRLPMADSGRQRQWLAESKRLGVPIGSTCLEILHRDNLKAHPKGPEWVEQSIAATAALGTEVVLLPFFGSQAITQRAEQRAVVDRLKGLAPLAQKAGVTLGLENTISAEDNAWMLDQVGSPAVKVYYDCGNSVKAGFDVYQEVVWLGKDRICQLHLKDGQSLLGQGQIDYPRYIEAVLKSGFEGWAMLETAVVTDITADFRANADYARKLLNKG